MAAVGKVTWVSVLEGSGAFGPFLPAWRSPSGWTGNGTTHSYIQERSDRACRRGAANCEFNSQYVINPCLDVAEDFFKGIDYLEKVTDAMRDSCIVYGGDKTYARNNVRVVGWMSMQDVEWVRE